MGRKRRKTNVWPWRSLAGLMDSDSDTCVTYVPRKPRLPALPRPAFPRSPEHDAFFQDDSVSEEHGLNLPQRGSIPTQQSVPAEPDDGPEEWLPDFGGESDHDRPD